MIFFFLNTICIYAHFLYYNTILMIATIVCITCVHLDKYIYLIYAIFIGQNM